jgi:hypothetical protein
MESIPLLSVDLIAALDELYPERCPSVKDSDRDIWLYAGKRELVRLLKVRVEQDRKETMERGL